jgi:hypothetical protein
MLCLINYARGQHGLAALSTSDVLMRSASLKADDEVACNQFTHTPCGKSVQEPFQRAGYADDSYDWQVGENLADAQAPLGAARNVMSSWLQSQEHRDNILSPNWKEQGIALQEPGSFLGLTGSEIWVSHFGERHPKPPPAAAAGGSGGGGGSGPGAAAAPSSSGADPGKQSHGTAHRKAKTNHRKRKGAKRHKRRRGPSRRPR